MTIRSLTYFIEVVKQQSFTKASKKLFVCQSALSKSIKNLEFELDTILIDRTSKEFKLTPEGEIFFENGIIALEHINEQISILLDSISLEKGKIKVGVPPVISTIYFTSIIQQFRAAYPSIQLQVIEAGANTVKSKVENGELDIGVVILPFSSKNFNVTEIFEAEIVGVVNKSHPLAKYDEVSIKSFEHEPFISLNEAYMLHDIILQKCKEAGFTPNMIYKSSQWDFIAELVALNQGVSILPKPILSKFHSRNIKTLRIKEGFPWHIALIVRKDKYISKDIKLFISFTKEIEL